MGPVNDSNGYLKVHNSMYLNKKANYILCVFLLWLGIMLAYTENMKLITD